MYQAIPDEAPPDDEENKILERVLAAIRTVGQHGGWGEVTVMLHAGCLAELRTSFREKPEKE